jgi:hypothetical protein
MGHGLDSFVPNRLSLAFEFCSLPLGKPQVGAHGAQHGRHAAEFVDRGGAYFVIGSTLRNGVQVTFQRVY